jgi:hypothetical protein
MGGAQLGAYLFEWAVVYQLIREYVEHGRINPNCKSRAENHADVAESLNPGRICACCFRILTAAWSCSINSGPDCRMLIVLCTNHTGAILLYWAPPEHLPAYDVGAIVI